MLICWLFYIHIPLLNAATYSPTVWMMICSSQGVHWVQVDLGSEETPADLDSCDCLFKQLDTANVPVIDALPAPSVAPMTPVRVSYERLFASCYSIRAPPQTST